MEMMKLLKQKALNKRVFLVKNCWFSLGCKMKVYFCAHADDVANALLDGNILLPISPAIALASCRVSLKFIGDDDACGCFDRPIELAIGGLLPKRLVVLVVAPSFLEL